MEARPNTSQRQIERVSSCGCSYCAYNHSTWAVQASRTTTPFANQHGTTKTTSWKKKRRYYSRQQHSKNYCHCRRRCSGHEHKSSLRSNSPCQLRATTELREFTLIASVNHSKEVAPPKQTRKKNKTGNWIIVLVVLIMFPNSKQNGITTKENYYIFVHNKRYCNFDNRQDPTQLENRLKVMWHMTCDTPHEK